MIVIPLFRYRAKTERGAEVTGTIEAATKAQAIVRLRQRGLWVEVLAEPDAVPRRTRVVSTPATEEPSAPQPRERWSFLYGLLPVTAGALSNFFEQLSSLYHAGVGMPTLVSDTASRVNSLRLQHVLEEVAPRVQNGEGLAACLSDYPQVFPRGVIGYLRAGELSGNVDKVARDLADDYRGEQRVWWLLMIPKLYFGIVLLLAILVPSFPWFISKGLPWWINHVLTHILPMVGLVVGAYMLWRILWYLPPLFGLRDQMAFRLPVWSALTRRAGLTRFYQALEVCVRAGVDFPQAMQTSAEAAGNRVMVQRLHEAEGRVRAGMPLHEALDGCGFVSRSDAGILGSAALGGTFDEALPRMAEQTKESRDNMVRGLRIAAMVVGYGVTSIIVLIACVRGYTAIQAAFAQKFGAEDLLQ